MRPVVRREPLDDAGAGALFSLSVPNPGAGGRSSSRRKAARRFLWPRLAGVAFLRPCSAHVEPPRPASNRRRAAGSRGLAAEAHATDEADGVVDVAAPAPGAVEPELHLRGGGRPGAAPPTVQRRAPTEPSPSPAPPPPPAPSGRSPSPPAPASPPNPRGPAPSPSPPTRPAPPPSPSASSPPPSPPTRSPTRPRTSTRPRRRR